MEKEKDAQEKEPFSLKKEILSWIWIIVVAAAIAFFLNTFIIANSRVPSGSMENTIMAGDRILALRTSYWFDEPEAGIDLWSFNSLIKVFEKMRDEINGTILIISHQERILDIADKIIVIADGQVRKTGTKAEVLPELLNTAQTCQTLIDKA